MRTGFSARTPKRCGKSLLSVCSAWCAIPSRARTCRELRWEFSEEAYDPSLRCDLLNPGYRRSDQRASAGRDELLDNWPTAPVSHQKRPQQISTNACNPHRKRGNINETNDSPIAHNGLVAGSRPAGPTNDIRNLSGVLCRNGITAPETPRLLTHGHISAAGKIALRLRSDQGPCRSIVASAASSHKTAGAPLRRASRQRSSTTSEESALRPNSRYSGLVVRTPSLPHDLFMQGSDSRQSF
ncbi:hypothetical protein SAMN05444158_4409 [Bradyrhizobium canariense]|uniref:Uncharacterized protein n=1 Tax=Bradyrhizobium canariense TaxID=255045 RepID=A0A1H1XNG6_9BRAD|nr:hypothetical protein SAMN05444158_4409 [Bradyrhizobium canariense]